MKKILFLLISLITYTAHSVIIRGEILRKKRPDGTYIYVYAFSDLHYNNMKSANINKQDLASQAKTQKALLMHHVSILPQNTTKTLIEDPFTHKEIKKHVTGPLDIVLQGQYAHRPDLLTGNPCLALKKNKIAVRNIDYRQKRLTFFSYFNFLQYAKNIEALAYHEAHNNAYTQHPTQSNLKIYHNLKKAGISYPHMLNASHLYDLPVKEFLQEIGQSIRKILSYNDGPVLKEYYANECQRIKESSRITYNKMRGSQKMLMSEFLANLGNKQDHFVTAYTSSFAYTLVDMHALHEIYQSYKNTDKIILLAGSAHTDNIVNQLYTIGYEKVLEEGVSRDEIAYTNFFDTALDSLDDVMHTSQIQLDNYMILTQNAVQYVEKILAKSPLMPSYFFEKISLENPCIDTIL